MRNYLSEIGDLLGEHSSRLVGLFLLFVFSAVLDLLGLGLIAPYLSLITSPEAAASDKMLAYLDGWMPADVPAIFTLGWFLVAVFTAKMISALAVSYRIHHICGLIEASLRSSLLKRYQVMPYGVWLQRNTSEYITAINSQVPTFVNQLVSNGFRACSDCIVSIVVLLFLAYTDWRAFLIIALMLSVTVIVHDRLFRLRLGIIGVEQQLLATRMTTGVRHAMEGVKELRVLGAEQHFNERLHRDAIRWASGYAKAQTVNRMPRYLTEFVLICFVVLTVSLNWWLVGTTQHLTVVFGVFALGAMRLLPATNSLMGFISQLRLQRNLVQHLARDWRELPPAAQCMKEGRIGADELFIELKADSVHFRYPDMANDAINGISISIRAGESIAFIGASGSGKTTLADVLLGFLKPHSGEVLLNGRIFREDPRRLLDHVAYLPQHVFLLDDTLRANVALGCEDREIDNDRVREALGKAQLAQLTERLPKGIDTVIGDRGLRLSGGQRQRVSLARAFYFNKSIIILDEATSALDDETEKEIVDQINMMKGQITLIVIAHRLSSVKGCDRIYLLDNGRVTKSGCFVDVLGQGDSQT
jgi:ABC-type multidrug transport system fused ATPase/permease subunit